MDSQIAHLLFRLMARVMDSPLRLRLSHPVRILEGAGIRPGQEVLEIGCGTGFFTVPAAELVSDEGRVYAMDPHPLAIEEVMRKIRGTGLAKGAALAENGGSVTSKDRMHRKMNQCMSCH